MYFKVIQGYLDTSRKNFRFQAYFFENSKQKFSDSIHRGMFYLYYNNKAVKFKVNSAINKKQNGGKM
jgi:hypothetical protein